jgi:DNA-damage-inducible protein J
MALTNLNITLDSETVDQAQNILSKLGLDLSTAVNLFLCQVICEQSVNFANASAKPGKVATLGGWEGKIRMADDFDMPLEDFWYHKFYDSLCFRD